MKIETKEIISWLRNMDLEPEAYSGRGMYGSRCLGVRCDNALEALWEITKEISGGGLRYHFEPDQPDCDYDESDYADSITTLLGSPVFDSMGLGQILYFPKFKLTDEDLDD